RIVLRRRRGREDAVAELGELAADVGEVGVDLPRKRAGLAGQVVLLGAEQDLVALADQQHAADPKGDDARQQQRYDEDRPQLEAAQEASASVHVDRGIGKPSGDYTPIRICKGESDG